jgi:hypothetical protein
VYLLSSAGISGKSWWIMKSRTLINVPGVSVYDKEAIFVNTGFRLWGGGF